MHNIFRDFEIQTDHLIPIGKTDLLIINKKENLPYSGFCCPIGPQNESQSKQKKKKKREKKDNYLDLVRELRKLWNKRVTVISWLAYLERTRKRTGRVGNRRTNRDYLDENIVKIGNWEESRKPWETCSHSESYEISLANAGGKISLGLKKKNNRPQSKTERMWKEG